MNSATHNRSQIPVKALRWTRCYVEGLRRLIEEKLAARLTGDNEPTMDDILSSVAEGIAEYTEMSKNCPPADFDTVTSALEDLDCGRFQTAEEILYELQGAGSAHD